MCAYAVFGNFIAVAVNYMSSQQQQQQQQHWHAIECCAWQGRGPKQLLLRSANFAQQRHNVAFVPVDGHFEGGAAVTAGRRVSSNHENNTTKIQ